MPEPSEAEQAELPTFESYPSIAKPELSTVTPQALGPAIGSIVLAERLDFHRNILSLQLGASAWDVSAASDKDFNLLYLRFEREGRILLARVRDRNQLIKDGVTVTLDPKTLYRFKLDVNVFNPAYGSTLRVDPVGGTQGPAHRVSTGELFKRTRAKSYVFQASGKEYWLLYATDVDPATELPAKTTSLLFIKENGMSTKCWPVAESSLEPNRPLTVGLDGTQIILVRTPDGAVAIHAGSAAGS
jgi:hypothetical protein